MRGKPHDVFSLLLLLLFFYQVMILTVLDQWVRYETPCFALGSQAVQYTVRFHWFGIRLVT